jgi:WD40 repeat protein/transcriptional regulator with XRE-family HTH domain
MSPSNGGSGDKFRGLILQLRGRIGLTQRELAARLDVHTHSVQAWEAGSSYPGAGSLRALIATAAEAGGFTPGDEAAEAAALWAAAMLESPRLRTPFDRIWFEGLLDTARTPERRGVAVEVRPATATAVRAVETRRHSWGEAPDVVGFVGRAEERERLRRWVLDDRCRVAGLYGLAGIGKTLLAAHVAHEVAPHFEYVYWRSFRDAPAVGEWLAGALAFLAPDDAPVPGEAAQAMRLLELLTRSRCLLVLDNFETVLTSGAHDGAASASDDGYASLLRQIGEVPHQSCLMLTSREAPAQLEVMRGDQSPVRSLHLAGFGVEDGQNLLTEKGLDGDAAEWQELIAGCGGNGLALKVTGETIRDLFGGSISTYLEFAASTPGMMIGGLRQVLSAQMQQLSEQERHLLRWLAVEREPVSFVELAAELGPRTGRGAALEAIEGLRRRSLLERGERQARFILHPVVLEYVTEQLIEEIAEEIRTGELDHLLTQPLVKATARDYVRRGQERLIAVPLLSQLVATEGSADRVERRLLELLDQLRGRRAAEQGYGPGNLVNLLRLSRGNLRRVDLSGLEIRQAFLQGVEAQDASLAGSHLAEVVLADAFKYPTSVTLSPDCTYLVAGTSAGEVCVWRVADRTLLATFADHAAGVRGVALSRDNRLVASCSFDGTVRLWEAETGRNLAIMRGHEGLVYAVALSDDGARAASGGQDGTVKLWDALNARLLVTLPGHEGGVWAVALSGDRQLVASGSFDGAVRLWDAQSGQLLRSLEGHTSGILGVSLSHDGRLVVSGSYDGMVRVWETETGRMLQTLEGGSGGIRDVALSGDGRIVASGSFDNAIRIWDVASGRLVTTLRGHLGLVYSVALSGDGSLVASGSFDGSVKLWETGTGWILANLQGYNRSTRSVSLSGDGRLIVSSSFEGAVRLWDAESGRLLRTLTGHATGVRDVALSPDGRLAVSGSYDGIINLWDVDTGRPLLTLSGPVGGAWGIALSGDVRRIAAGTYDGSIRIWSAENGRLLQTLEGHDSGVREVKLSRDGRLLVSGSEDKTVKLWEVESGRVLASFEEHTGGIWSVALSADHRRVASSSDDRTIRIWEAETGRPLATLIGHTDAVWSVALSEDGRRLASASFDGTVRIWDVEAGGLISTFLGHDSRVTGVALSADGLVAVSAGVDGTVRVWETDTGVLRHTLLADRRYERLDISGLTGLTDAQHDALLVLGAVDRAAGTT